jgi:hypothetical protein
MADATPLEALYGDIFLPVQLYQELQYMPLKYLLYPRKM